VNRVFNRSVDSSENDSDASRSTAAIEILPDKETIIVTIRAGSSPQAQASEIDQRRVAP
jgi:hypothetical protein